MRDVDPPAPAFDPAQRRSELIDRIKRHAATRFADDAPDDSPPSDRIGMPHRSIEGIVFPDYARIAPDQWDVLLSNATLSARAEGHELTANPQTPSFANTFEALEVRQTHLDQTVMPFLCAYGANQTKVMTDLATRWQPQIATLDLHLLQNKILFQRCKEALATAVGWSPAQHRLATDYLDQFRRAGADMDRSSRDRLLKINERLEVLSVGIQEKITQASSQSLVFTAEQLAGLDTDFLNQAALDQPPGQYRVTLDPSRIDHLLSHATDRSTRQIAWRADADRNRSGPFATQDMILETLSLRQEQASLLGFPSFAALQLHDRMAATPERARGLVMDVWSALKPVLAADLARLSETAKKVGVDPLEPWDVLFFLETVRASDYGIGQSDISDYLSLDRVRQAAFDTAESLFGIRMEKADLPVYHPQCQGWLARDQASGRVLGALLTDDAIRSDKPSGAWMDLIAERHGLGAGQKPIAISVCNIQNPDRLSLTDAKTVFHEFGHALHALLSQNHYPAQAGPLVDPDWVELPSQLLENWIGSPAGLKVNTRHRDTGQPMPASLVDRVVQATRFGQSLHTAAYLQSCLLDLDIHQLTAPPSDLSEFAARALADLDAPSAVPPVHPLEHFSHLFCGEYAAGYYGYVWAEVLDADVFSLFTQRGLFDRDTASSVLEHIYAAGDREDPSVLFERLMGRPPSPSALMERLGLQSVDHGLALDPGLALAAPATRRAMGSP